MCQRVPTQRRAPPRRLRAARNLTRTPPLCMSSPCPCRLCSPCAYSAWDTSWHTLEGLPPSEGRHAPTSALLMWRVDRGPWNIMTTMQSASGSRRVCVYRVGVRVGHVVAAQHVQSEPDALQRCVGGREGDRRGAHARQAAAHVSSLWPCIGFAYSYILPLGWRELGPLIGCGVGAQARPPCRAAAPPRTSPPTLAQQLHP